MPGTVPTTHATGVSRPAYSAAVVDASSLLGGGGEALLRGGVDVGGEGALLGDGDVGGEVRRFAVPTIVVCMSGWLSVNRSMNSMRVMPSSRSSRSACSQRSRRASTIGRKKSG